MAIFETFLIDFGYYFGFFTSEIISELLGGLSLHLKPPYSITHGKLRLAIWDTSFWTFWLKFGHKGP